MIKRFYSIQELLELGIPKFPKTHFGIIKKAEREKWVFQERNKLGGGREYSLDSLPVEAKEFILKTEMGNSQEVIEYQKQELANHSNVIDVNELKPYQREVIDARAIILAEIDRLALIYGTNKAIQKFVELVFQGDVPEEIKKALVKANAKSGGKPVKISRATIFNWKKAIKESGSIAGLAQKEIREADWPAWGDALLKLWQVPGKPSLSTVLENLVKILPVYIAIPSYSAAQRFLKKLPAQVFNKGRVGTREMKKYKAYVARSTANLWPTAVYTADGHTFDAEIENPLTGKLFRPEITTVVDVYTRKVVGWSLDLSERTNSVYMALTKSIITHGIPCIWYVDNGKGFNNRYFDDEMVGLLARLKIEKKNSIAYNSQARGIAERIHQTIWVKAAKNLATYMGADMDTQAKQAVYKKTRKDISEKGRSDLVMSWDNFKEYCTKCVEIYNNTPHRSLPVIVDQTTYKKRNMTPSEFWNKSVMDGFEAEKLSPAEIKDLYRYYEVRRTNRGLVQLFTNSYFSLALEPYHGRDVAVAYDIHDASKVWVRELMELDGEMKAGRLICEAIFEGNSREYFPISKIEFENQKRAEGRVRRLKGHMEDALDETRARFLDHQIDIEEITTPKEVEKQEKPLLAESDERPFFADDVSWAKWLLSHPDKITDGDVESLIAALKSPEMTMLFEAEDISLSNLKELIKKAV
ncbi:MAG: Mu transposase C-terminal domain-containing protein [Alphaproteobacteria bacterium]